jgi:hypothetical protein
MTTPQDVEKDGNYSVEDMKPSYHTYERVFLTITNILIISIMLSDFMHFTGLIKVGNLQFLTLGNLVVVVLAYFSFLIKQRMRRRIERYEKNISDQNT